MKSKTLIEYLDKLTDKRRAEGKRHNLSLILILLIMSTISQYYGYRGVNRFIKKNRDEIIKHLQPAKERLPSLATIRRVILNVDFDEFAKQFKLWAKEQVKLEKGDWVSIDGKSIKSTMLEYHSSYQNFVSIVSAYAHKSGLVMSMMKFENKKKSEIGVVSQMIEQLGLKGVIFSMDALHCKKNDTNNNRHRQ